MLKHAAKQLCLVCKTLRLRCLFFVFFLSPGKHAHERSHGNRSANCVRQQSLRDRVRHTNHYTHTPLVQPYHPSLGWTAIGNSTMPGHARRLFSGCRAGLGSPAPIDPPIDRHGTKVLDPPQCHRSRALGAGVCGSCTYPMPMLTSGGALSTGHTSVPPSFFSIFPSSR